MALSFRGGTYGGKPVSLARLRIFWKAYDEGRTRSKRRRAEGPGVRPWFDQHGVRKRQPVAVSPSVMGVPREFKSRSDLQRYVASAVAVNLWASTRTFDKFVFWPIKILDVDYARDRLVEQGYPTINVFQLLNHDSRKGFHALYGPRFLRRIKGRVSVKEAQRRVQTAYFELVRRLKANAFHVDANEGNVLVLDFDPATGKPVLTLVDYVEGSSNWHR